MKVSSRRYLKWCAANPRHAGDFVKAARLCPKVCGHDTKRWEDWIFVFAQKHQLQAIIPYVPTEKPTLGHLVYEMILAYFLSHDRQVILFTEASVLFRRLPLLRRCC